ncbi:MAG: hypothetical protein KF778_12685 [Rhodocyclaceae bacterium]|nr:hypothetical protein [Rhodocyclaceae bacterium]
MRGRSDSIAQTARALGLHRETVATWPGVPSSVRAGRRPRQPVDLFKARIVRLLESHRQCPAGLPAPGGGRLLLAA